MPKSIEPAPRIGTKPSTDFLKGMGKHYDSFIMILNIDRVFTFEGLCTAKDLAAEQRAA